MFPIFLVDYPFIRKGHSFTMKSNSRARTKAAKSFAILGGLWLASAALVVNAQQSAKSGTGMSSRSGQSKVTPAASASANDPAQVLVAGQTAHKQRRFEEALRNYNRVITLTNNRGPLAAEANFGVGNINMAQGKFGNAQVAFERAIALNPADAESYNNLGEALGQLKQYTRALEAFNKAISLDQKLLKAKYNQAVSYDRMGNFRYSEFVFRSLIKSSPQYSLSYDGLAVTLSKAGRAKEAIAFHEKAIALDPREPSYYFNYAISYLMLGNTAKAMEQQEKLKAIDPAIADRLASVIVKRQM